MKIIYIDSDGISKHILGIDKVLVYNDLVELFRGIDYFMQIPVSRVISVDNDIFASNNVKQESAVVVRDTQNDARGKGIFATRDIKSGELIGVFKGAIYSEQHAKSFKLNEAWLMAVGWGAYMYVESPLRFTNHSCNPNAGVMNGLELRAIRDITRHEEITMDYDTIEYWFSMQCSCGQSNCRSVIRGYQHLSEELRTKYIQIGVVMPYLLFRILCPNCGTDWNIEETHCRLCGQLLHESKNDKVVKVRVGMRKSDLEYMNRRAREDNNQSIKIERWD